MDIIYVTVGTTRFDNLIKAITSDAVLRTLRNRGCKKLILQLGHGERVSKELIEKEYQIQIEQYDFKFEDVRKDIQEANLTIGHAGAGTCMDILHLQKPGLLITNEDLMGNHQLELAEQMAEEGYIFQCTVKQMDQFLKTLNINDLKPYEHSKNMPKFINSLNDLMS